MAVHLLLTTEEEKKNFSGNLEVVCYSRLTSHSGVLVNLNERLATELTSSRREGGGVITDLRVSVRALLKDIRRTTLEVEKIYYLTRNIWEAVDKASRGVRVTRGEYTVQDKIIDDILLETADLTNTEVK